MHIHSPGHTIAELEHACTRAVPTMDFADDNQPAQLLYDWTHAHGWYDLQRRLFDHVNVDLRGYAVFDQRMTAMSGRTDGFEFEVCVLLV